MASHFVHGATCVDQESCAGVAKVVGGRSFALLAVISLALLLYGLIERHVRRVLASRTAQGQNLLAKRIGRATGRNIIDQLSDLATVRVRDGPTKLAEPRPVQQLLLQLLESQ
jgi:hypothetical protein